MSEDPRLHSGRGNSPEQISSSSGNNGTFRPHSAGSHASYSSHDSSISWLLNLDHHGGGNGDGELFNHAAAAVTGKRQYTKGQHHHHDNVESTMHGSDGRKKNLSVSRDSVRKEGAIGHTGVTELMKQTSHVYSPYERDPLPPDLQRELELQLVAKGRMPKNGKVDKFGNVVISASPSATASEIGEPSIGKKREKMKKYQRNTNLKMLQLFQDFKKNPRGKMASENKDKLVDEIVSTLKKEARLVGSSIFLEQERSLWGTPLGVKQQKMSTKNSKDIRAQETYRVESLQSRVKTNKGNSSGFITEQNLSTKHLDAGNRFDPLYHIMLEESRLARRNAKFPTTSKSSELTVVDLNSVRKTIPSAEEWVVHRVIFFLFESYFKLVVVNDPAVSSFDVEGVDAHPQQRQQQLVDDALPAAQMDNATEQDIPTNLWRITQDLEIQSSGSSQVSFTWSLMLALLRYPKSFLSILKEIEGGNEDTPSQPQLKSRAVDENYDDVHSAHWKSCQFYRLFGEKHFRTLSQLCSTSLFHPACTEGSSPITSQLCAWARRVISGLYLFRAGRRMEEEVAITSLFGQQLPYHDNNRRTHHRAFASSNYSTGTNESTSLASSQLFEAVDHVKSAGLPRGVDMRSGGDSGEHLNDDSPRNHWTPMALKEKILVSEAPYIPKKNLYSHIAIICRDGRRDQIGSESSDRLVSAGLSLAKCSDKIEVLQINQREYSLPSKTETRQVTDRDDSSTKRDVWFKRRTISSLHNHLALPRRNSDPQATADTEEIHTYSPARQESNIDPSNGRESISFKRLQSETEFRDDENRLTNDHSDYHKDRLLSLLREREWDSPDGLGCLTIVMTQCRGILEEPPRSVTNLSVLLVPQKARNTPRKDSIASANHADRFSLQHDLYRTSTMLVILSIPTEMNQVRNAIARSAKFGDRILLFHWIPADDSSRTLRENEYNVYRQAFGGNIVVEYEEESGAVKKRTKLDAILSHNPTRVCLHVGDAQISNALYSQSIDPKHQGDTKEDPIVDHLLNSGIETLLVHK